MKTIKYIALCILVMGCSVEPIAEKQNYSNIDFSGQIPGQESKTPVPECTGLTPNQVRYTLQDAYGQTYTETSPITLNGQSVTANEQMRFISGTYDVIQVDLLSDNVVTHTAPNEINNPDFRDFVLRPLPYTITLLPDQTYNAFDQFLCYTIAPIELSPIFQGDGEVIDLITIYFYIDDPCINQVTLTVDNYRIVEWPIFDLGLNSMPAPASFNTASLIAYDNDLMQLQQIIFTEYNQDGILDENDILYFDVNCN